MIDIQYVNLSYYYLFHIIAKMNYSKLAMQNYHKIVTYHKIDVEMKCFWYSFTSWYSLCNWPRHTANAAVNTVVNEQHLPFICFTVAFFYRSKKI